GRPSSLFFLALRTLHPALPAHPALLNMDLNGKVALITGAKRIGSVVAGELGAHGADVAISYGRSKTEAEQTADRVRAAGRRSALFQADLTDAASCQKVVADVVAALGRLDVL